MDDVETVLHRPTECLYCGNTSISIKKKTRSSQTKSVLRKIWLKVIGGSWNTGEGEEYTYIQQNAIVECPICGRCYEVVGLSDERSKDFVYKMLCVAEFAEGMENQILMFMKKRGIKSSHIYENLVGITVLYDPYHMRMRRRGRNGFHVLFRGPGGHCYFANFSIIPGKTSFQLTNISYIQERFIRGGGVIQ